MSALWVHVEELESNLAAGDGVALSGDEARHVAARRLRVGDRLIAFDGAGRTAEARIEALGKRTVELRLETIVLAPPPPSDWLLATAIPKGERMAVMLPMLTQLAVSVWQPLVLEESAVRDLDVASARLRRILVESAKLARRPWLLEVRPPCTLGQLLAARGTAGGSAGVPGGLDFGDREGDGVGVPADSSVFAIGPEAGFTAKELEQLRAAGGRPRTLGPHNLRIETAAVAAAALRCAAAAGSSSLARG